MAMLMAMVMVNEFGLIIDFMTVNMFDPFLDHVSSFHTT